MDRRVAPTRVVITQRVDVVAGRAERRDALDQAWGVTLEGLLGGPVVLFPLPNHSVDPLDAVREVQPHLILLSGGNDIGDAPERDAAESALLGHSAVTAIPVVGVCRGMQMIQHHLGGTLQPVHDHVARDHELVTVAGGVPARLNVNSFHEWGITNDGLAPGLDPLYEHPGDATIEAFVHRQLPWLGVMWHPERAAPDGGEGTSWLADRMRELVGSR